jgi:hypothetical protein
VSRGFGVLADIPDLGVAIGGEPFHVDPILVFYFLDLRRIVGRQLSAAVEDLPFGDPRLVHRARFGNRRFLFVGELVFDDA